jgi:hypothetical protein
MKKFLLFYLLACLFLLSCNSQPKPASQKATTKQEGFAVIELFTSQGCSSCPPADALLGREIAAYEKMGKKLVALSFHVDYWNRLGWTDPYSQSLFTQRQYRYAAKLKGDGVYTPQAIVNGQQATVGGNQAKLESFIKQALAEKPGATLSIDGVQPTADSLQLTYQYSGPVAELHAAIVQQQVSTPVKAGENGGRTLTNYHVVRSWQTVPIQTGTGAVHLQLPTGYEAGNYALVLYAQEKAYGKILAADSQ